MAWYIVIPISNIKLNVNNYSTGNINLYQANTYNIQQIWNFPKAILTPVQNAFQNKVILEAPNIIANTRDEAVEITILELAKIIDLLSIKHYRDLDKLIVTEPNLQEQFIVLTRNLVNNNFNMFVKNQQHIKNLILNQREINDLNSLRNYFPFINKIPNNYSELEKRISTCIHWCRKGNMESRPEDRLAYYFTGFEKLLVYENRGSKKDKIANRTAIMLSISKQNRQDIRDKIIDAYDLRNKVMHEAFSSFTDEEIKLVDIIRIYCYDIAFKISKLSIYRKTLKGFLEFYKKKIRKNRINKLRRLNSINASINSGQLLTGARKRYHRGQGKLLLSKGHSIADINLIIRFIDDNQFVYIEGTAKNYRNINLRAIQNKKMLISVKVPALNKRLLATINDFEVDIGNCINNNQNINFISYDFQFR